MSEMDPTLKKFERKLERMQIDDEAARKQMKGFIKEALVNDDTHRNMAAEMLEARRENKSKYRGDEAGFNLKGFDDGEVITGFGELPWNRDTD